MATSAWSVAALLLSVLFATGLGIGISGLF